jgi:hypothetical protein
MSLYIQIADFKAQSNVAKDKFTKNELQDYIDKFEVIYLQDLLGAELYEEFATDFAILGTEPTDPKFVEIWNSFAKDESCSGILRSIGIKEMLGMFINFEYIRDQPVKNNIGGPQVNVQANSSEPANIKTNLFTNYNEAISTYKSIQWIIHVNPNNYDWSSFHGVLKSIIGIV